MNDSALVQTSMVQIMAWRLTGDKPLSEPMMVSLLTHICLNELMKMVLFMNENKSIHSEFTKVCCQWPLLLTWINFNHNMGK